MSTPSRFFSTADIRDSIESLERTHGKERPFIYWMFLGTLVCALGSIFVIKVDVSVGGVGQIRPETDRFQVFPVLGGVVSDVHVSENQRVKQGEVLLRFESATLDARMAQNSSQDEENTRALHDLNLLLARDEAFDSSGIFDLDDNYFLSDRFVVNASSQLKSPQYMREHASFSGECQRLLSQIQKEQLDYRRTNALWEMKVVSDQDNDDMVHRVNVAKKQLQMFMLQTLGRWQAEKVERELKQVNLATERAQLLEEKERYAVVAPIDGVAIGFKGIHIGVFLPQGQVIGELSPDARLQAEVYVSPRDVGFVQENQNAKVLVDAFPHTEWGILEGRVRQITQDFVQVGQNIAFRALVDLENTTLTAPSGLSVDVRRGMTVSARFLVRRTTLFRLLYSKMSDSFDPRDQVQESL